MTDESVSEHTSGLAKVCSAVALVGFMGAGKTTVGRELALRLGWHFADIDELVQEREQRTVEQIFREDGEPVFRRLEFKVVREAIISLEISPMVLALGGGAFIEPGIQECLRTAEVPAVFLDAPVAELFRRCDQPGVNRPLRRNMEEFQQLYERRRPEYLKATTRIETTGKTIATVAQEIISGLNLVPVSGARA
jgi:shikimate kinase